MALVVILKITLFGNQTDNDHRQFLLDRKDNVQKNDVFVRETLYTISDNRNLWQITQTAKQVFKGCKWRDLHETRILRSCP